MRRQDVHTHQTGFTIVELLIVIVVIGLLASLVLNTFNGAQERARISNAQAELKQIETAVRRLQVDTGKWPNGCPANSTHDPEVNIEIAEAGLLEAPSVGVIDSPCEWVAADVQSWNGPYLGSNDVLDPWEQSYKFDPDYYPYQGCSSETTLSVRVALASYGPDGTRYTCDDVYREISY